MWGHLSAMGHDFACWQADEVALRIEIMVCLGADGKLLFPLSGM